MTFRLPYAMAKAVEDEAHAAGIDKSDLLRDALANYGPVQARVDEWEEMQAAVAAAGR